MVIHPRPSQTRTMCSLTHNAAATMTNYPRVDLPPRGPTTQMLQPTFSLRLPACSVAARAMDSPGLPSNRDRDQTRIESLAMCSRTYVPLPLSSPFTPPPLFFFISLPPNGRRGARRLLTLLFRPYPSFYGPRLSGISRCGRGWAQHVAQA